MVVVLWQEPVDIAGCAVTPNTEALMGSAWAFLPSTPSGGCNYGALREASGLWDWHRARPGGWCLRMRMSGCREGSSDRSTFILLLPQGQGGHMMEELTVVGKCGLFHGGKQQDRPQYLGNIDRASCWSSRPPCWTRPGPPCPLPSPSQRDAFIMQRSAFVFGKRRQLITQMKSNYQCEEGGGGLEVVSVCGHK